MRLGVCLRLVSGLALTSIALDAAAERYQDKAAKDTVERSSFPSDKSHKESAPDPLLATLAPSRAGPRVAQDVGGPGSSAGSGAATAAAVVSASERLDDRKILQVTHVANQIGIDQARLAKARATDPRVRQLADTTLASHADAERKGRFIAQLRDLDRVASKTSERLVTESKEIVDTLREKTGPEFDRAYVDAQIEENKKLLSLIDRELAPNARDDEVRALVYELRPQLRRQLNEARMLQQKLKE